MRSLVRKDGEGKLRVLHAIGQLWAGGLERQLCGLLEAWSAGRLESSVVTFAAGGRFFEPIAALGVPITVLPRRGPDRVFRLAAHLRRLRPHLVYAWGTAAMVYGRVAGALALVRVVTHDGSTGGLPLPWRVRAANLALLPLTAAFVCNSQRRGAELRRRLPVHASRIAVIENGVSIPDLPADSGSAARLRAELDLPEGPIVGCVGRLDRLKNQEAILEAARLLADRGLLVSVVLVGEGPARRALVERAAALGIADRLRLVGEQRDVGAILRGFAAFAFPTLLEGMPNAVQEALACGVPVVASDVGDVRLLLSDGACGVVIPPGDVAALADGLVRVLREGDLATRLAAAGRRHMRERYSMESSARRTEELFDRVVASTPVPFLPLAKGGG